jgi:hypothetical protein
VLEPNEVSFIVVIVEVLFLHIYLYLNILNYFISVALV